MNNYVFCALVVSLLFFACDGADHEILHDDYCYFQPQLTELNVEDCFPELRFVFTDESGVEYSYPFNIGETIPVVGLPKNHCFTGRILWVSGWENCETGIEGDVILSFDLDITLESGNAVTLETNVGNDFLISRDFCLDENCNYVQN